MIEKVKVIDWCISCRNCETVCPTVFKVSPKSEVISDDFEWKDSEILQAELMCPVNVIKVEKKWNISINFKEAILVSKIYLTEDILELNFKTENFNFKPWQYISLQMSDLIWKFSRSYSIAKWDKNNFTLNIKVLKKWRWWTFLSKLKENKKIKYLWSLWNFYLQNTEKEKVFIATWTGLAPIIAMLEKTPKEIKKTVIFWVRFEKDIYYKELLETFSNTKVVIKISKPTKKYLKNKWRVTDCLDEINKDSEIYICWNPEMVDSVKDILEKKGHSKKLIFNESFSISRKFISKTDEYLIKWNIPGIKLFSNLIILFSLIIIPLGYNYLNTQILWDISWWAVVFVMWIRPLSDIFPKIGILSKLVSLRKSFWILSATIVVTALAYKFYTSSGYLSYYFTINNFALYDSALSRASEITAIILLLTSNNFSQKKLWIWWKKIQRLSYIYFISWWIIAATWTPYKIYPAMIIVIILWILAFIKQRFFK